MEDSQALPRVTAPTRTTIPPAPRAGVVWPGWAELGR